MRLKFLIILMMLTMCFCGKQSGDEMENQKELIGTPVKSDNRFTHQARMLQGWYRANVLKLPQGHGPTKNSKMLLPNMIPSQPKVFPTYNFLNTAIYQTAITRLQRKDIGGTIEEFRLFHNMLSSQPMAFNLFAPLAQNLKLASQFFRQIYPDVQHVTEIIIEYAPLQNNEYLRDRTAFDVFVDYKNNLNQRGFIGIEVKYTETFSPTEYEKARYKELTNMASSPFSKGADELKRYNQLWRNTLLAYSLLEHPKSEYKHGHILLAYMKEDVHVDKMIPDFKKCLKQPEVWFQALDVRDIIKILQNLSLSDDEKKWINEFSLRYLRFDLVEGI